MHNTSCPALFAFQDAFVVGRELHEELLVRLERIIKLKGEKVFGIRQLLDHQRQDFWAERN